MSPLERPARLGERVSHADAPPRKPLVSTGRRRVRDGRLIVEIRREDGSTWWTPCRPHEGCSACAALRDHDGCPEAGERAS